MTRRPLLLAVVAAALTAAPGAAQTPRVAEVQVAPPFVRMVPDAQVQASATAYDSAGTPLVVRFRWSSSNINVATVSENGLVRGVAPGTALIYAVYEGQRGGRRRALQVQVSSRVPGPGVFVTPPMTPMPGAPPSTPVPGMVFVSPHDVDSVVKASINCNEPMISATNPLQACYDQRPTPRAPPVVSLAPCPEQPNSANILVMARVTETGTVTDVMPFVRRGCPELIEGLVAATRAMTFNPALREGKPTAAWVRIMVRNTEAPPKQ